jgi:hypothetical protein
MAAGFGDEKFGTRNTAGHEFRMIEGDIPIVSAVNHEGGASNALDRIVFD